MASVIPSTFVPATTITTMNTHAATPATPNALLARAATAAPVLSAALTPIAAPPPPPLVRAKRPRTKSPDSPDVAVAEPKIKTKPKIESKKPLTPPVAEVTVEGTAPAENEASTANKDWLIVAKSVRAMLKAMPNGMHCGAEALPMLNSRVQEMLTDAASRASGNGRKTLKACDF